MSSNKIINLDFGGREVPGHRSWVTPSPSPVPMLWVIPPDLINGVSSKAFVSSISSLDNIQVWQFDGGAVAFSMPDILVKMGRPLQYEEVFLKRTRPLFQIVDSYTTPNHDALDLEIPDTKYWVRISLKREETNKQSCVYFKSQLNDWNPFTLNACSSYNLTDVELKSVKEYLANWLLAASAKPVFGESLQVGTTEMTQTTTPATDRSYPKSGFEVRCSNYVPCTWPWIDFYLRMRKELHVKKRLSIAFFNNRQARIHTR